MARNREDRGKKRGKQESVNQQIPVGQQQYYQQGSPQQNPYGQQGYYQQPPYYQAQYLAEQEMAAAKKKKRRRIRKTILFIFEVLVLAVLAIGLYVAAQVSRVSSGIQAITVNEVEKQSEVAQQIEQIQAQLPDDVEEKLSGYWNIALYGVDSRYGSTSGQGDTIMIASINKATKDVKLVSVYRDTYLDNTAGSYQKATDCYGEAGPNRSMNMLNKNLDLDITDYVTVNMNVLTDVIDRIGGVEIYVDSEEEATWINNYQNETSLITDRDIIPVTGTGLMTLNGLQATSYCRIRAIGNDYQRTERQREVLTQVLKKFQSNPTLLLEVIDALFENVETNLTQKEIMDLAVNVASYHLVETVGFPFEKQGMSINNDIVAPINLAKNVIQLHQFLFENEEYSPSETVQAISNELIALTGLE